MCAQDELKTPLYLPKYKPFSESRHHRLSAIITCADPWVEYSWDGVYPTYPSASIMTGDYGMQKGEVVDKIIYINNSNADTQIWANNYLHDESYTFADHKPVVAEFTYVKKVK